MDENRKIYTNAYEAREITNNDKFLFIVKVKIDITPKNNHNNNCNISGNRL